MSRLASSSDGAAVVHERALVLYDVKGARTSEQKLDRPGAAVARFGDEWLVLAEKQKHLSRIGSGVSAFAAGKGTIGAFGVGLDDTVAVTRGSSLELWSRDDERRWSTKGGPFIQTAVARDHVVALGEDGALYFFGRDKGEALGALRLASPDPASSFRLAHVDACIVVLALGEWLVWIDCATRKTVRRVRARGKVLAIAADKAHVVVAVEDGHVQAFRASTGEPRASFAAHDEDGVTEIALGPDAVFTIGGDGAEVRVCDRQSIDVTVRAASPVSSIASRGGLAVVGDRSGRVRVVEPGGGDLREIGTLASGEGLVGLFIAKDDSVVAAGQRVILRVVRAAWSEANGAGRPPPRPVALRAPPTAFAADDVYAFTGTQAGAVDVYDLEAGRPVTSYELSSDDRITALVRLSGATLVVGTGALDGRVLVVDVAEAKVVHRTNPHEEAFGVTCLAADGRGRIVASGSDDGSIALIDPAKGRVLAKLRVNETPTALAFEPSGRRLACVFADGTAAIVTFAQKGATVSDLGLRGATHVSWGDGLVFGFRDGSAECGERHARPSDGPGAART